MDEQTDEQRGLFEALVGDGRPLLKLTGIGLIGSGLFAFFLGATGHFLPHDIAFLGVSAEALYSIADGRLAHFMIHDRVSFGGAILGVGVLYLWLAEFPLRAGQAWAWWTLLVSGALGFASFWRTWATAISIRGMEWRRSCCCRRSAWECTSRLRSCRGTQSVPLHCFGRAATVRGDRPMASAACLLLVTSLCLVLGGLIIMTVGMTTVFVPTDLEFMKLCVADLDALNPRLVPLIAHDRAGFGGGVCCCGLTMFFCIYCSGPSRSLWQALAVTGVAGFGTAIGVHFPIGYTNVMHLAPAFLGSGDVRGGNGADVSGNGGWSKGDVNHVGCSGRKDVE